MKQERDITAILFIIMTICVPISYAEENTFYRLPKLLRAETYYLNITVNIDDGTFRGDYLLDFSVLNRTDTIEIHKCKTININKIFLRNKRNDSTVDIKSYNETNDVLVIKLVRNVEVIHRYLLEIKNYEGVINQKYQKGFYCQEYQDENGKKLKFAAAVLTPTYARTVFPCFDEPDEKAKFKISIIRHKNYNSVSNGLLIRSSPVGSDMVRDDFQETLMMPTYLVSFIISQLSLSDEAHIHRALARPQVIKQHQTDYSINAANNILNKFEQYLDMKYPLKHLYHAAIPMDLTRNMGLATWGLIIYKESFFIHVQAAAFEEEFKNLLIGHQIAHLYFGNLITVNSWSQNWFQEGLADYLSFKLVSELHSDWLVMMTLKFQTLYVLYQDSSSYSTSLEGDNYTPVEIHDDMHLLTRSKGSAMIEMLESLLTPILFQKAIRLYLKKYAYETVTPQDFYRYLDVNLEGDKNFPIDLSTVMHTWDSQTGYPVVEVTRNYGSDTNHVKLTQTRFVLGQPAHANKRSETIWFIPINYATEDNPNFHDRQSKFWLTVKSKKFRMDKLNNTSWLIVNKQGGYFYRVNYDQNNWDLITRALLKNHKAFHALQRMQLIDDSYALSEAGVVTYEVFISLLAYFRLETEFGPFSVFKKISIQFRERLRGTKAEKYVNEFLGKPVEAIYHRLENSSLSENHSESTVKQLIFIWVCQLNLTLCKSETEKIYVKFRNGQEIPSELEEQVLCNAIRMNKENNWNNIFKKIRSSENVVFEKNKFLALACTDNSHMLKKYLNYAKSSNSDRLATAMIAVSLQGRAAGSSLLEFLIEHMVETIHKVGENVLEIVLHNIAAQIHSRSSLEEFKRISTKRSALYKNLFHPAFEKAERNIQWRAKYLEAVTGYLKNPRFRSGSTRLISSNIFAFVMYYLLITETFS